MSFFTRKGSAGGQLIDDLYQRCSRCKTFLRIDRTPRGGRFTSVQGASASSSVAGKTVYIHDAGATGCWFCGTPAWDGYARPGDLSGRRK